MRRGSPPGQDPDKVPAQRLGVGNVARTDGGLADNFGIADPGPHPGDHAAIIGQIDLRSHHPQLIDAGYADLKTPIPWWNNRTLQFTFPPR